MAAGCRHGAELNVNCWYKCCYRFLVFSVVLSTVLCAEGCRFDGCDASRSFHLGTLSHVAFSARGNPHFTHNKTFYPGWQCTLSDLDAALMCSSRYGGPSRDNVAHDSADLPRVSHNSMDMHAAYDIDRLGALKPRVSSRVLLAPTPGVAGLTSLNRTGTILWKTHALYATGALPIIDINGNVFGTDGTVLVAFGSSGRALGPSIVVIPSMGSCFSMVATSNQVFVIASHTSDVATYLTNGVPLAPIWLNVTLPDGENVTYAAVSTPLVAGTRVYLSTAPLSSTDNKNRCRLYAIDVHRTMIGKITYAWHTEFLCDKNKLENTTSAILTLWNQTICTVGHYASTTSALLCYADDGLSGSLVYNFTLNGTVHSMIRGGHSLDLLFVTTENHGEFSTLAVDMVSFGPITLLNWTKSFNESVQIHQHCPLMAYNQNTTREGYVNSMFAVVSLGLQNMLVSVSIERSSQLTMTVDWLYSIPDMDSPCDSQLLASNYGTVAIITNSSLYTLWG